MSRSRETAPLRVVGAGVLSLIFGWASFAFHQSGSIDWSLRVNRVPALFQLSRTADGWQFDLVVAMCGLVALAGVVALCVAVWDLIAPEKATA